MTYMIKMYIVQYVKNWLANTEKVVFFVSK